MAGTPSAGLRPRDPDIRGPAFRPDRLVDLVRVGPGGDVYEPSIAPFERMVALDRVLLDSDGETPVLALSDPEPRPLPPPPGGAPGADEAVFWGSALFDFARESRLPLPNPAPGSRVLQLRAEPNVPVRLLRDAADNLYVEAPAGSGPIRLLFEVAAPLDYFGGPLPPTPLDRLPYEPPPLPPEVRRRALRAAAELGVTPGRRFDEAVARLAAHFRAFDEHGNPPRGRDVLLAFVRGGRGVCRHRAYAFVVLAQALGIRARFVHNTVHAWAEVLRPGGGWLRVDLGGALIGRPAAPAAEPSPTPPAPPLRPVPPFHPPVEDPLPKPPPYRRALARLEALRTPPPAGHSPAPIEPRDAPATERNRETGSAVEVAAPADPAGRVPVRLHLAKRPERLVRGDEVTLGGMVERSDGQPAPGYRVEAWLVGEGRWLLGVALSGPDGRFALRGRVPADLPVGRYRLELIGPGDGRYAPARAP